MTEKVAEPPQTAVAAPKAKRRLDLDAVRGVAILLAMGWHFNHVKMGNAVLDAILAPGRTIGWAGVDLFFVLSGFLIGSMIFHDDCRHGGFDYPKFFVRRVMRLWPALYAFLFFSLLFSGRPWRTYLWQIGLHVSNYFRPGQATHLWSLAVEEHFYLIIGLGITIYLARKGELRNLWKFCLGLMIVSPIFRLIGLTAGVTPDVIQWQTQYRMDALAGGVLLANLSVYHGHAFDRLLKQRWPWAVLSALGGVFLWNVGKATQLGAVLGFSISYLTGMSILLLVYRAGFDHFGRPVWQAFAFLGQVSYSAYLWHVPVAKTLPAMLVKLHLANNAAIQLAGEYIGTVIVAYLGLKLIEQPSITLRNKLFPSRGQSAI